MPAARSNMTFVVRAPVTTCKDGCVHAVLGGCTQLQLQMSVYACLQLSLEATQGYNMRLLGTWRAFTNVANDILLNQI
eukprot:1153702-Pelagomonas_calceolata.AAC.14